MRHQTSSPVAVTKWDQGVHRSQEILAKHALATVKRVWASCHYCCTSRYMPVSTCATVAHRFLDLCASVSIKTLFQFDLFGVLVPVRCVISTRVISSSHRSEVTKSHTYQKKRGAARHHQNRVSVCWYRQSRVTLRICFGSLEKTSCQGFGSSIQSPSTHTRCVCLPIGARRRLPLCFQCEQPTVTRTGHSCHAVKLRAFQMLHITLFV